MRKLTMSSKNSTIPIKPTSYIICSNSNNLYGNFLTQLLLTEIRVKQKDFNLNNYPNDSPIGCFLKVDLDYADKLHNLHIDILLTAEKYGNSIMKSEKLV